MNATTMIPAKAVKSRLMAEIESAIALAPEDSTGTARNRKRLAAVRPVKNSLLSGAQFDRGSANFRRQKHAAEVALGEEIRWQGCTKLTFVAGPVTYTVWNNKQTLTEFLSRVRRYF